MIPEYSLNPMGYCFPSATDYFKLPEDAAYFQFLANVFDDHPQAYEDFINMSRLNPVTHGDLLKPNQDLLSTLLHSPVIVVGGLEKLTLDHCLIAAPGTFQVNNETDFLPVLANAYMVINCNYFLPITYAENERIWIDIRLIDRSPGFSYRFLRRRTIYNHHPELRPVFQQGFYPWGLLPSRFPYDDMPTVNDTLPSELLSCGKQVLDFLAADKADFAVQGPSAPDVAVSAVQGPPVPDAAAPAVQGPPVPDAAAPTVQGRTLKGLADAIDKYVKDPRASNKRHKFSNMFVISQLAIISGATKYSEIVCFGRTHLDYLDSALGLPYGIPDESTFSRIFARVDYTQVRKAISEWLGEVSKPGGRIIGVDGKVIKGSDPSGHAQVNVFSAWDAMNAHCLAEIRIPKKKNEISQIGDLIAKLGNIENDIITADALNCQWKTARLIYGAKAFYFLGLKRNQHNMFKSAVEIFDDLQKNPEKLNKMIDAGLADVWQGEKEEDHGRDNKRKTTIVSIETSDFWKRKKKKWRGIKYIVLVENTDENGEPAKNYYITSCNGTAEMLDHIARNHWSIENKLHWCLDVIFCEDKSRVRSGDAPVVKNIMFKTALFCLRNTEVKHAKSIMQKRYCATLDINVAKAVFTGKCAA